LTAEARDAGALAYDQAAATFERDTGFAYDSPEGARQRAGAARAEAASERARAASDREQAARDREQAANVVSRLRGILGRRKPTSKPGQ